MFRNSVQLDPPKSSLHCIIKELVETRICGEKFSQKNICFRPKKEEKQQDVSVTSVEWIGSCLNCWMLISAESLTQRLAEELFTAAPSSRGNTAGCWLLVKYLQPDQQCFTLTQLHLHSSPQTSPFWRRIKKNLKIFPSPTLKAR